MRSKIATALMLLVSTAAMAAPATVTGGWFRALPPAVPSGGYFQLKNISGKKLTLTGIETSACGMAMMHRSINGGMDHVMSLDIAAGETASFAPGGYHLMCMDAKLKPGATVPVTFRFADGQTVTANFAVKTATGK